MFNIKRSEAILKEGKKYIKNVRNRTGGPHFKICKI